MLTDLEELDPTQRRIVEALYSIHSERGTWEAILVDDLMERCRVRNRSALIDALEALDELCWLMFNPYVASIVDDQDHVVLFSNEERRQVKADVKWINEMPEDARAPEEAPAVRRDEPFEMPF